jgi:hypothetical protein
VAMMCLAEKPTTAAVSVIVRRDDGPVEFLIGCDKPFPTAVSKDPHITIDWTRHGNRDMCRVARKMPVDV